MTTRAELPGDWSRTLALEGRRVEVRVEGCRVRITGRGARPRNEAYASEARALAEAHLALGRLAAEGYAEDRAAARALGAGRVSAWVPALGVPALEARLAAWSCEEVAAGRAPFALVAPLLLVSWPAGARFAAVFEARPRDRVARAAVAGLLLELADDPRARPWDEALRVALVQQNREALPHALRLLARTRGFEPWMDVLELADDVGDRSHGAALEALDAGRVPRDAREPLHAVTRNLRARSPRRR